ncbi:hypothetical protein ACQP1O_43145 (plasmid) [Nocardia sp. CA-151230]|uniref:hypothetical protein n=1 Tax=Nocardia sp. CA-151230 TaxID=3239982 RepID=UPI003D8F7C30
MVAGREATPKDAEAVARLKEYWTTGSGGKAISWGSPGDYDRCVALVTAAVKGNASFVKGYCAELHIHATGMNTTEHAKMVRAAEGRDAIKKAEGKK